MRSCVALLALTVAVLPAPLRAQAENAPAPTGGGAADPDAMPRPVARALPTAERIVIDGRLEEASWALAEPLTDFVQSVPFTGLPASQRTVARILYNPDHLYIGAVCYDTEIGKMMIAGLEHDFNSGAGDIFGVTLDTLLDRRNSLLFLVNPGGALRDEHTMNDSRYVNAAWNAGVKETTT